MIVVTGGAGFIGSNLVKSLNEKGLSDIIVVDSLRQTEKWKNLVGKQIAQYYDKAEFLELIENSSFANEISAIAHLGACSSTTELDAAYMMENNYRYSQRLALVAAKHGVRFVYASSAATYGDGSDGFDDDVELLEKLKPLNVYAYSKHLFDLWAKKEGLLESICGLKFFNVYGPNEYHKGPMQSVILKAFEQICEKGQVKLFKSYRKDYADEDCCETLSQLLSEHKDTAGIFNIGSGKARSWNDLAKATFSALEKTPKIEYIEMPDSLKGKYQYYTEAPVSKISSALGNYSPAGLEKGVASYVQRHLMKDKAFR
ncbi:UNVERIFIED_CONTAM: hypothetical protein GTU68_045089 [Idotea baltica]|nr:hypothetical protein [Idotea baltica]